MEVDEEEADSKKKLDQLKRELQKQLPEIENFTNVPREMGDVLKEEVAAASRAEGLCGRYYSPPNGRNKELVDVAEKVLKKMKTEVEEKGLRFSITEGGKEGKSKVITSCRFWEESFQKRSEEQVVTLATIVETLGVDLRTRTKQLGEKEKSKKEDVRCEICAYEEKSGFPEKTS